MEKIPPQTTTVIRSNKQSHKSQKPTGDSTKYSNRRGCLWERTQRRIPTMFSIFFFFFCRDQWRDSKWKPQDLKPTGQCYQEGNDEENMLSFTHAEVLYKRPGWAATGCTIVFSNWWVTTQKWFSGTLKSAPRPKLTLSTVAVWQECQGLTCLFLHFEPF